MSFLVFSNLFVAVCAASLVWATSIELGLPWAWVDPMVGLVFFATLLVYNLDRVSGTSPEDAVAPRDGDEGDRRHRWIARRRRVMIAMGGIGALGAAVCALMVPRHVFGALIPLGLISLTYSLPILPGNPRRRLKDIPGLKIFLIAAVWGAATVSLPAWFRGVEPWRTAPLWLAAERTLFIFVITLPFDVRDMRKDAAAGVRTIPQVLGVAWTRRVAILGLCGFMASATVRHEAQGMVWPLALSVMWTGALLARLAEDRSERYYTIWIEGTMLIQSLAMVAWFFLT